jgi:hypothetical protein
MSQSLAFDPERLTGDRQEQLAAAFDRVCDPRDWKAEVRAEIPEEDRLVVEQAIHWFTDTVPMFVALPGASGRLEVRARGYRLGSTHTRS